LTRKIDAPNKESSKNGLSIVELLDSFHEGIQLHNDRIPSKEVYKE